MPIIIQKHLEVYGHTTEMSQIMTQKILNKLNSIQK